MAGGILALAPAGLICYMAYLWRVFGNPLLFYQAQSKWDRSLSGPVATLGNAWRLAVKGAKGLSDPRTYSPPSTEGLVHAFGGATNIYALMALVFVVVLLVAGLWLLPVDMSIYSFALVVLPAFYGAPSKPLMGSPRYVLVAFPLFIVRGVLLKNRWALAGWLLASIPASLILCALFVSWHYVA